MYVYICMYIFKETYITKPTNCSLCRVITYRYPTCNNVFVALTGGVRKLYD